MLFYCLFSPIGNLTDTQIALCKIFFVFLPFQFRPFFLLACCNLLVGFFCCCFLFLRAILVCVHSVFGGFVFGYLKSCFLVASRLGCALARHLRQSLRFPFTSFPSSFLFFFYVCARIPSSGLPFAFGGSRSGTVLQRHLATRRLTAMPATRALRNLQRDKTLRAGQNQQKISKLKIYIKFDPDVFVCCLSVSFPT